MKAVFDHKQPLTDSITSFSFKPEGRFAFTAGQYVEITLVGHQENSKPSKRWFTISSSPNDDVITITTRVGETVPHFPFKRALNKLDVGDLVDISEPLGDFVLPKLIQTPLVFVAGGIGITPFHSILEWLAETDEQRPIRLLYGVKTEDDIIFQDTFAAAGQHATIVVEEPSAAWGGMRGRLNAERIIGLEEPSADTLIYLSGPEPFVQAMQKDLLAHGISNQNIVLDEFQGYSGI